MTLRLELADLSLASLDALEADSLAAFVGSERPLSGLPSLIDWRLAGAVSRAILAGTVTPEHGEALLLPSGSRLRATRIFLFGIDDPSPRAVSLAVRHACEALRRAGARQVLIAFPHGAPCRWPPAPGSRRRRWPASPVRWSWGTCGLSRQPWKAPGVSWGSPSRWLA